MKRKVIPGRAGHFAAFWLTIALAATAIVSADIKLPAVISDNMVLQQGAKTPIWGWADPGEKISISVNWQNRAYGAVADEQGKWMTQIAPPRHTRGSYEMTIRGKNTITIKNILVGEVWVCSGQSNMEMPVGRFRGFRVGVDNYEQEIAAANYPKIRLFTVAKRIADSPQADCSGAWASCSPETVAGFSGAAYFFGRQLHNELKVPVGLILTCWGATPAEAWTRREVLNADPQLRPILERYDKGLSNYVLAMKDYGQKITDWLPAAEQALADGGIVPDGPPTPQSPKGPKAPCQLYNGMIAPIIPYAVKGAIWYQGESNTRRAYQYRRLFPAMINNWRADWGQGDFPFYYVQLAPYNYSTPFIGAELREAQLMTMSLPNTGMAVTMDICDPTDIHPQNKQDVGKRLALWALAKTYGRKGLVCSGPVYKSMKTEGGKIRLSFDYVGGGLVAKGRKLTDFTVAAEDKVFVEAQARIEGDTIVVSSDKVKKPAAVRFAWRNGAAANLFNKEGLPASFFRTDDWPGVTINEK